MERKLVFTPTAAQQLIELKNDPSKATIFKQIQKTLGYLQTDLKHHGLQTHEFSSLAGANGEKVFEAYVQNRTPGAYRIFWQYGPDEVLSKKRVAVLTIIAITPHP